MHATARPAALAAALSLVACAGREPLEVTRDRARARILTTEIADLERLVAEAERGDLITKGRIVIGVTEQVSQALIDASLPQEHVLAERIVVRVEHAKPLFDGNNAILVFEARLIGKVTGAEAHLELAGRLGDFRIEAGKLEANVRIEHFTVLDSSLPDIGSAALDALIRANLDKLSAAMPGLAVPVRLEHSIDVPGLLAGPVATKGGGLSLELAVAEVLPVRGRLWILLSAKVGNWRAQAADASRP